MFKTLGWDPAWDGESLLPAEDFPMDPGQENQETLFVASNSS